MGGSFDDSQPTPLRAEPAAPLQTGVRLGKYELVKQLSVGGMAEIFLARVVGLPGFQKLVVIKRILPQLACKQDFLDMFLDEARIAATLQHPSIVQTYDVCVVDGSYFIAMEYLHGEDLRSILRTAHRQGRRVPIDQVLQIMISLCSGLHYAHEKEGFDGKPLHIVHCDVSPGNVIVTYEGGIKLVDFGIARAAIRAHETRSGTIKGKIGYMSPEQARAERLDRRTDVFAAGVILYELSLGKKLYKGTSDYEILHQIVEGKIVPPRKIDPAYDEALEKIVLRALERQPDKRYQTAHDLQMALEAFARERAFFLSTTGLKRLMEDMFGRKLDAWREAQREGKSLLEVVASFEEEDEDTPVAPLEQAPRRRWVVPAVAAAGLAALIGLGVAVRSRPASRPSAPVAIAPAEAAPGSTTAPTAPGSTTEERPVAAAPEATAPAEAPKPADPTNTTGSLKVVTHPHGAVISIDGVPTPQRSPAVLEGIVQDREHVVVVQLDGYKEVKKRVSVAADKRTTLTLTLPKSRAAPIKAAGAAAPTPAPASAPAPAPAAEAAQASGEGTLAVASNPWCTVAVDGVEHGQTPVNIKLAAGKHTLTLTNPEFHIKRQLAVTIKPNETLRKKLDFSE